MKFNPQTIEQVTGIILVSCIEQCNKMQLPELEYDLQLKAMLRERLGETGQKELAV